MARVPRRYLITIGCPSNPDYPPLNHVERDIQRVVELFTDRRQGYHHVLKERIPLGAQARTIEDEVSDWFADPERTESDCVVVYVAGHGDIFDKFHYHYLITSDTNPRNPSKTAVKIADIPGWMFNGAGERPGNILLILDTCWAGQGTGQAAATQAAATLEQVKGSDLDGKGRGLYMIASADADTEAGDGDGGFVNALMAVMEDDAWMPEGGTEYLNPLDLCVAIDEWCERNEFAQRCEGNYVRTRGRPPFLRNPRFTRRFDGLELTDRKHWVDASGPFFTGRKAVLRELTEWLEMVESDGKALVVTGAPGSGKSAVLARLVISSTPPQRVASRAGESEIQVGAFLPSADLVDVSIHIRGMDLSQATYALASQLKINADIPVGESRLDSVLEAIQRRTTPTRIVIDALDEAIEPEAIEAGLLRQLNRCTGVRLVVGSRRRGGTVPLDDESVTLDLDAPQYFDATDLTTYVRARLMHTELGIAVANPFADPARMLDVERLSAVVAERADKSFLIARLVTRALRDTGEVPDTSYPGWETSLQLPTSLKDTFQRDLNRFDDPARRQSFRGLTRRKVEHLLLPLAYAKGKGLPQKTLWYTLASALSNTEYRNNDIRDLKEVAGYYLVQDSEHDETVYRLFHESFAEYLREKTHSTDMERRFTEALRTLAQLPGEGRISWDRINEPYLSHYYPAHAGRVGLLDREVMDPAFLLTMDVNALLGQAASITTHTGRAAFAALREASQWLRKQPSDDTAVVRLLWFAQQRQVAELAERLKDRVANARWWPEWCAWSNITSNYVVGNAISGFIAGTDIRNGPVALCRSKDTLCVYNLETGETRWQWKVDNETPYGRLWSISSPAETAGSRQVAVVGDKGQYGSKRLCLLDLSDGTEISRLEPKAFGLDRPLENITALCLVTLNGELHLATASVHKAGDDADLCLWRLPDFHLLHRRINASQTVILTLHHAVFRGVPTIISCADNILAKGESVEGGQIKIWNANDLSMVLEVPDLGSPVVLAACEMQNHLWLLVRASQIFLLEPETNNRIEVVDGHYGRLKDVIDFMPTQEGAIILSIGHNEFRDQVLRRFNIYPEDDGKSLAVRREPIEKQVEGQSWSNIIPIHGRPHLVSADNNLRVWDYAQLTASADIDGEGAQPNLLDTGITLTAVASNAEAVVTGDFQGRVGVWDIEGRRLWNQPIATAFGLPKEPVKAVMVTDINGAPTVIVGTDAGNLFCFDLRTGLPKFLPLNVGGALQALTIAPISGKPAAFAAVELKNGEWRSQYAVRVWDILTGEEIDTRLRYYESLADVPEGAKPWGLQAAGYYNTKPMPCVAVFNEGENILVVFGGPHGSSRVMNLLTLDEVDQWAIPPAYGDYVNCLAADTTGEFAVIYAGTYTGRLIGHSLAQPNRTSEPLVQAHKHSMSALRLCNTPLGVCLVSAGDDGLAFWTYDLSLLGRIELPITGFSLAGNDRLVVIDTRGVSLLHVDFASIMQGRWIENNSASENRVQH